MTTPSYALLISPTLGILGTVETVLKTQQSGNMSYLLALGYSEQLSAAFHSMVQLRGLAYDWKAHLVEPTLVKSHLFGVKGFYPRFIEEEKSLRVRDQLPLFEIFDQSKINNQIFLSHNQTMKPFEDFLRNAPRNIVLIHFNVRSADKTKRLFTFSEKEVSIINSAFSHGNNVSRCDKPRMKTVGSFITKLENHLTKMSLHEQPSHLGNFRVLQMLCLNPRGIYRSDTLLPKYLTLPVTVIFTNWHGCSFPNCSFAAPLFKNLKYNHDNFRYAIFSSRTFLKLNNSIFPYHHNVIEETAHTYLKSINYRPLAYISIHMRVERIIRRAKTEKVKDYQSKCVHKLLDALSAGRNRASFKGSQGAMVISDSFSQYGSDSCSGRNCNQKEITFFHNSMKRYFDFNSYVPPEGTTHNSGFVSLVEMHMLALGAKLVLVGTDKSSYQINLAKLFLSKGHNDSDIHRVIC